MRAANDDALLGQKIHAAHGWLARRARWLTGDRDLADDLAQETVLVALRHDRLGADESDRSWRAHVLRNALLMRLRCDRRRAGREAAVAPLDVAGSDLDDRLETAEQVTRLRRALAQVREPFHTTLRLRYFDGAEPTEIARRLGVPASTIRRRHQLAIAELRRVLQEESVG